MVAAFVLTTLRLTPEMDISEARLAIIASNANLTPEEVDVRVADFVAHDELKQAEADYKAAAEERERLDDEERARRRAVFSGDAEPDGKSTKDILADLQTMVDEGNGW